MSDVGIRDYVHAEMLRLEGKEPEEEKAPDVTDEYVLAWFHLLSELPEGYDPQLTFKCTTRFGNSFEVIVYNDQPCEILASFNSADFKDRKGRYDNGLLFLNMAHFFDKVKRLCK